MFLKPFRVKTQTSVKSSDRKKLRSDILNQYPCLTEQDVATLVPNKEEMSATKICTSGDDNVLVYSVAKNPIFYDIFKRLYPTVYTLWQFPEMLPTFRTWPPVFSKLQKGADLMLPGVIPDKRPSPKMFGNLQKGDLVTVTVAGNKAPVALGKALLSGEDMYMSALRGKGVSVLHIAGDTLWEFGDKSNPPCIPEPVPKSGEDDDGDNKEGNPNEAVGASVVADLENVKLEGDPTESVQGTSDATEVDDQSSLGAALMEGKDEGGSDEEEDEEEQRDPVAEMDERLHFCFACAIKGRVKKSELPVLTGNFLRNYMQPFSADKQLDIKKSTFKKFSKFLQLKVKEGYICMKEQSKGVDVITEIDKSHLGLRDIEVPEVVEAAVAGKGEQTEEETFTPLSFTDVYCINAATQDIFKEEGFSKGDALIVADVRQCVTNYIRNNNLHREDDKKQVTLDPVLAHIILKPAEGDLDHMNWEQVINRVMGKMQQATAIISGSGPPTIKKGKLDPIKLDVAMRASQKKVTVVDNLEDYGIDVKVFSRLVQRSLACSCSVAPSEQKNKGPQVLIQGNQINFVANVLIDKYKIPRRYVTGLDNAPKQKKKR
ncbi:eukaryotic translation initiation factor 2D [Aplysia californica]|uniref:Eukaryotic translation initiation factor 2D n=1 Tax=Aplysia californica TaxID=6500 RepID=A0ABM0JUJ6_APLCA|nr:eukaryotic translation initiation factor 2D [Aplysia californica]